MAATSGAIRAGRAFVELFADDSKMTKDLKAARSKLSSFATHANRIGRTMVAAFAVTAAAVFPAMKAYGDFSDQMLEVRAVTSATAAEFAKLTEQSKLLGRTTSFTAAAVAGAQAELGRAGFKTDSILKMTSDVLSLSRATKTDLPEAAGIAAATLRQFGLAADESSRVVDRLTFASNNSFNTLGSLAEALKYAGPVAADLNMSLEDTLAILATLGNLGIQGSSAGNALKRLAVLGAAEAEKLGDIFGRSFTTAAGDALPLVDVLEQINEATKDLGTAERTAKLNEAFGLLGITGASAIGKAAGSVKELREQMLAADGVAQSTAEMMDSGFGGAMRRLWSAVEGVGLAIGESLAPHIAAVADYAGEAANTFTDFISRNRELVTAAAAVATGVGAAGVAITAMGTAAAVAATAITGTLSVLKLMGPAIAAYQTQAILLETTLGAVVVKQLAFNAALVAGKAALVALVGVGVYKLTQEFTGLRQAVDDAAKAMELAALRGSRLNDELTEMRQGRQARKIRELESIDDPEDRKAAVDAAVERAQRNQTGIAAGIAQAREAATATRTAERNRIAGHDRGDDNPLARRLAEFSQSVKDADARVAELEQQKAEQDKHVNDLLKLQAETNRASGPGGAAPATRPGYRPGGSDASQQVADALMTPATLVSDKIKAELKRTLPAWMGGGITFKQGMNMLPDFDAVSQMTAADATGPFGGQQSTESASWMDTLERRQTPSEKRRQAYFDRRNARRQSLWDHQFKHRKAKMENLLGSDFGAFGPSPELEGKNVDELAGLEGTDLSDRKKNFDDIRESLQIRAVALQSVGAFGTAAATGLQTGRSIEKQDGQKVVLDEKAMMLLRQIADGLTGEVF